MMILLGIVIVVCWVLVYMSEGQDDRSRMDRLHRASRERRMPTNYGGGMR